MKNILILNNNKCIPVAQVVPLNSKGHWHWNILVKSIQVPLFIHGEEAHRSTSGVEIRKSNRYNSVAIKHDIIKKNELKRVIHVKFVIFWMQFNDISLKYTKSYWQWSKLIVHVIIIFITALHFNNNIDHYKITKKNPNLPSVQVVPLNPSVQLHW